MPSFAAIKAVILHPSEPKFLAIKHNLNGKEIWDLPGGQIDAGETPFETLHREAKEEVYLEIKIGKFLGFFWFLKELKPGEQVVCSVFQCITENPEAHFHNFDETDGNIVGGKWVTKAEFLEDKFMVGHPSLKEVVKNIDL
ncbi:MAG: NUDIX domain-containing protein [Patescibacteria group bacterium]|nr:NUDIX domain-containing protein [Patescibacteria group bacterium]